MNKQLTTPSLPGIKPEVDLETTPNEVIEGTLLEDHQEFFIPVHEFVRFTADELAVINHPAFQRLGRIYQLGQAHLVYRGATHKRLEHVLGTVHVAQTIVDSIKTNHRQFKRKKLPEGRCKLSDPLNTHEVHFIRLAALLHDIGHLPAGHTLEDELCLLDSHEANRRLELVFKRDEWKGIKVEQTLGKLINEVYLKHLPLGCKIEPVAIVQGIVDKHSSIDEQELVNIRIDVCRDIVGNTICADLLDYLHRDWYHIGKPRFFDKRLYQYMYIRQEVSTRSPKFVISYGSKNRPKHDAVSSILELLESRYNLAEAVLFHPTKCSAAAMLERATYALYQSFKGDAAKQQWLDCLSEKLLDLSDEEMFADFLEQARKQKCIMAVTLFGSLINRKLHKSFCTVARPSISEIKSGNVPSISDATFDLLTKVYLGTKTENGRRIRDIDKATKLENRRLAAGKRFQALAMLEEDLKLSPGSFVMYCPPLSMNSKIAEVKMEVNGSIKTLEEWDSSRKLAGGHCRAQLERFERLWRAELFITKAALEEIENKGAKLRCVLEKVAQFLIFGVGDDGGTDEEMMSLAQELVGVQGSPYYGQEPELALAARGGEWSRYPMDTPTLKSLFEQRER
jgi:HD superfamily phosphohydrolase